MFKVNKKLIISSSSILGVLSFTTAVAIPMVVKKENTINKSFVNSNTSNKQENFNDLFATNNDVKPLVPSVSNFENAKLVTKQGPIVFWKDTIKSLDWFGAERWSVDLTKLDIKNKDGKNPFPSTYGTDIKRSWVNWELDRKNNKIWILSNIADANSDNNGGWNNGDKEFKHQYLISLSTYTGKLLDNYRLNRNNGRNDVYRNVSIFYDGTPIVYGLGFSIHRYWASNESQIGYSFTGEKLNLAENKMTWIGNTDVAKKFDKVSQENLDGMDYLFNVIPIANNRNLFLTVKRANIRSSSDTSFNNDVPFEKTKNNNIDLSKRDMSITAILLDNNLKEIKTNNSQWVDGKLVKLIESASDNFKNKYTFPQRDWYTLLDGRVVTIIYDTLLIFDPSNPDNPTFNKYKIGNDGDWVESWTFDTNENLFYKLYDDSKIFKLTLDKIKEQITLSLYIMIYKIHLKKLENIQNHFLFIMLLGIQVK